MYQPVKSDMFVFGNTVALYLTDDTSELYKNRGAYDAFKYSFAFGYRVVIEDSLDTAADKLIKEFNITKSAKKQNFIGSLEHLKPIILCNTIPFNQAKESKDVSTTV